MHYSFYQISQNSLEDVVAQLLEKALDADKAAYIYSGSLDLLSSLDGFLWSLGGTRFVPHVFYNDDNARLTPVLLGDKILPVNNPEILFITKAEIDVEVTNNLSAFKRVVFLFSQKNESENIAARNLWKELKNDSNILDYFAQDEKGKWHKKG